MLGSFLPPDLALAAEGLALLLLVFAIVAMGWGEGGYTGKETSAFRGYVLRIDDIVI